MDLAILTLLILLGLTAIIGYILACKYLYQGFENTNKLPLIMFLTVLVSSVAMLAMMVLEIVQAESKDFRLKIWITVISILNYSTLFIVPLLIILRISKTLNFLIPNKLLFTLTLTSIYTLTTILLLLREASSKEKNPTFFRKIFNLPKVFKASTQFNFISKIGVCILSALSGFGCIYMPFQFFRYYNPLITQINKEKIEDDMRVIMKEIITEKLELAQIENNNEKNPKEKNEGIFSGIMSSLFGRTGGKRERNVTAKRRSLKLNQQLLDSLFIDYTEISEEERNFERVSSKRCRNYFDKFVAVGLLSFGVYKVFTTSFNLYLGRKRGNGDPVSTSIKFSARIFNLEIEKNQAEMITTYGSLLFIGGLIITNLRGFTLNFLKFMRIFFRSFLSQFISSEFMLLLATEIIGNNLPAKYKENMKNYLPQIDYESIYWNFDVVFLFSTIASFLILFVNLKTRHFKYTSYASDKDD